MWACGHGFGFPAERPETLNDFLFMAARGFDCAALGGTSAGGISRFAWSHIYLAATVAGLWRLLGVNYAALWPLLAVLHGAYAAGGFVLARLYLPRLPAVAVGLALALSPLAISMLMATRDYAKAPFFVWSLALLVLAIRGAHTDPGPMATARSPVSSSVSGPGSDPTC